jgi:hypothetical protein
MRDKDPNDSSKVYTLPFNAKNFEQLFKQRPGQSPATVSLSIFEEGSSEKPRQITNPEKFKSTPFDELWNEATYRGLEVTTITNHAAADRPRLSLVCGFIHQRVSCGCISAYD